MADEHDDLLGIEQADDDAHLDDAPDDADLEASDDGAGEDEQDRPRDASGRFVPVSALKGLRKDYDAKLEKLEKESRELREKYERGQQKPEERPQLTQAEAERMQRESERLDTLEEVARMQFTDEVVDAAQAWFTELQASDPYSANAIQSARNPYKELIKRFEKHLVMEELAELQEKHGFDPADPDGWAQKRAAALAQQAQGGTPQQQASPERRAPPRSLASAPSSGGGAGTTATGPGQAFDDAFG